MNLSLIIFCYNEKQNIENVIRASEEVAGNLANSFEIIVVDDGSTDGTEEVVNRFPKIKFIRHATNSGIGMALRSGYAAASQEYVCAIPGDGQFDVHELLKVKPFGFYTFYSFYRTKTNYNYYRQFLTKANRIFNRLFLDMVLHDVNWIKVYRRDHITFTEPRLTSSLVESEICAKLMRAGCKPVEIPSTYFDRKSGTSTGGQWKTLSKALNEMFGLFKVIYAFKKQPPRGE